MKYQNGYPHKEQRNQQTKLEFQPMIDSFERHINPSRIILCVEVRELYLLHVYI